MKLLNIILCPFNLLLTTEGKQSSRLTFSVLNACEVSVPVPKRKLPLGIYKELKPYS